jgi:hypothetical protein
VEKEQAAEVLRAGFDHLAAAGIEVSDEAAARVGVVLDAARDRLTDADWAALRRGPAAWRDRLTGSDTDI